MSVRGSLDVVTTGYAEGWVYPTNTKGRLVVQAMLNHAVIGEAVADLHRGDLAEVGLGDGNYGYHIEFYNPIDVLAVPFVVVKLDDGDLDVPRTTESGYAEFFQVLYRHHPTAGRHRSVYGGLWTDRTDGAALLRGRVAIGQISEPVASVLSRFLQNGFLVLESASRVEAELSSGGSLSDGGAGPKGGNSPLIVEFVRTLLTERPILEILQPLLEDHPLAMSASIVDGTNNSFSQPSAFAPLPSPAECVALIIPTADSPVGLEVVRDSHLFPEFTASGQSRWINQSAALSDATFVQRGMVDRYELPSGSIAIVGPGLMHRVQAESSVAALRVLCTPSRHAPLDRRPADPGREIILETGGKIWL